ncbi:MAG: hypothetical protein Q9225_001328 [Loekoesia sp. 1 TL-2023]
MDSLRVDPRVRFHEASDPEYDDECGSVLAQCGSRSSPSILSNDLPEFHTLQNLAGAPFEMYAQQLGAHLAWVDKQSEAFAMSLELELLSSLTPASGTKVHTGPISSSHEQYTLRHEYTRSILAHVDCLFTEAHNPPHQESESAQGMAIETTAKSQEFSTFNKDQEQSVGTLYDLEKQICMDELRVSDHRRWNAVWSITGRILCLAIVLAALGWQHNTVRA